MKMLTFSKPTPRMTVQCSYHTTWSCLSKGLCLPPLTGTTTVTSKWCLWMSKFVAATANGHDNGHDKCHCGCDQTRSDATGVLTVVITVVTTGATTATVEKLKSIKMEKTSKVGNGSHVIEARGLQSTERACPPLDWPPEPQPARSLGLGHRAWPPVPS